MSALLHSPIGTPCPDRARRMDDALAELGYPSYPHITPPKSPEPWVIPVSQTDEE